MYRYRMEDCCPYWVDFELDGDVVHNVKFNGGCNGNLKAIAKIADGKTVDELAAVWEGNTCGRKKTSCADQFIKGMRACQAGEPSFELKNNSKGLRP